MKRWIIVWMLLLLLSGCADAEPQPSCGPDGPSWTLHNINQIKDLDAFVNAAKSPEAAEQWINENWYGSWSMLSGFEEFAALAAELEAMPFPSFAAEPGVKLTIYPDYGRDYVIVKDEEKTASSISI